MSGCRRLRRGSALLCAMWICLPGCVSLPMVGPSGEFVGGDAKVRGLLEYIATDNLRRGGESPGHVAHAEYVATLGSLGDPFSVACAGELTPPGGGTAHYKVFVEGGSTQVQSDTATFVCASQNPDGTLACRSVRLRWGLAGWAPDDLPVQQLIRQLQQTTPTSRPADPPAVRR